MKYFLRMNFRNLPFFILLIVALTCTFTQADEVPTKEIKIKELTLQLPETWIKKESSNQFRLAEFDIPAPESELENAELVLFHFQGGAGKTDANITRWLNQFESDGRVANFKEGKTEQGSYIWVDISGTYK
ncbi:MAG: hypothetical protein KDA65_10545, partial [Planctomycetaceae bacterium]|nr:hypothetical protein [Planctomycetaceae bacterium]